MCCFFIYFVTFIAAMKHFIVFLVVACCSLIYLFSFMRKQELGMFENSLVIQYQNHSIIDFVSDQVNTTVAPPTQPIVPMQKEEEKKPIEIKQMVLTMPSKNSSKPLENKRSTTKKSKTKYIRYKMNNGGFANNVFGMVSSYLIAELLGATFVCTLSCSCYHIVESDNTFKYVFTITDLRGNMIQSPQYLQDPYEWTTMKLEYDCVYENKKMTKQFINQPIEALFNEPYINIYSNCPLFSWMALNPETYKRLVDLGLLEDIPFNTRHHSISGFYILSKILREHVTLTKPVIQHVSENLRNQWNKTNRIGIHIRKGDELSDFRETRHFLMDSDVLSFLTCDVLKKFDKPVIYLSSDSKNAKKQFHQLNQNFGYRIISSANRASHTSPYAVQKGPSFALFTSVADMISLAQSELIIGTQDSTFSVVAAAFQGQPPYLISKGTSCMKPDRIDYYTGKLSVCLQTIQYRFVGLKWLLSMVL